MDDKEFKELKAKCELAKSETWKEIRKSMLNNIVFLAGKSTDPIILKGMLKNICDTDAWVSDYIEAREKEKEQ